VGHGQPRRLTGLVRHQNPHFHSHADAHASNPYQYAYQYPHHTETPTITPTFTPSAPFEYVVQEDDNCQTIAEKFDADVEVMLYLNNLDSRCIINVGATILIPAPGQELPTATPLPTDIAQAQSSIMLSVLVIILRRLPRALTPPSRKSYMRLTSIAARKN